LAELAAEGESSRERLDDAFETIEEPLYELGPYGRSVALLDLAWGMWTANWTELEVVEGEAEWREERWAQASLVREVFGNPFRPVILAPSWPTWNGGTAVKLARAIYDERAFDRLPVLADALEEAGCDHADLTAHCCGPGPHVRGCWAVDLLLGFPAAEVREA
jgi:hypothetical protein